MKAQPKQRICFFLILLLWAGLSAAGYYYSGRRDPTIDFPTGWSLRLIVGEDICWVSCWARPFPAG